MDMEHELNGVIEKFKEILTPYHTHSIGDPNICCSDYEKFFLLQMADAIKIAKPDMSEKEICIAVVKLYYSLNLGEQTEVYFNDTTLIRKFDIHPLEKERINRLYLDITTGDIMVDGRNLSQTIREFMFQGKNVKGEQIETEESRRLADLATSSMAEQNARLAKRDICKIITKTKRQENFMKYRENFMKYRLKREEEEKKTQLSDAWKRLQTICNRATHLESMAKSLLKSFKKSKRKKQRRTKNKKKPEKQEKPEWNDDDKYSDEEEEEEEEEMGEEEEEEEKEGGKSKPRKSKKSRKSKKYRKTRRSR